MTLTECLEAAESRRPLIDMPAAFSYYYDSSAPDGGNGLSPSTAFNNLNAISFESNKSYGFARGSYWRSKIDTSLLSGLIFGVYGSGNLPVLDCTDFAANNHFSLNEGSLQVYKTLWPNQYGAGVPAKHFVWENNTRLYRCVTLSECESTAGSFFYDEITGGQPSFVYVHSSDSSNIIYNGKQYEITVRDFALNLGDNTHVYFLHTKRNGANDGSFRIGINAFCYGILAEDGEKHNLYFQSGTLQNCTAYKCDKPKEFGGATMYVLFNGMNMPDPLSAKLIGCNMLSQFNDVNTEIVPGMIGFYSHHSGSTYYDSIEINGGYWAGASVLFSAELFTPFTVKNTKARLFRRFIDGSTISGKITTQNNNIVASTDYFIYASGPVSCTQDKVYSFDWGSAKFISTNNASQISLSKCTVISNQEQFYLIEALGSALPVINISGLINHGNGNSLVLLATGLSSANLELITKVTAEHNFYAAYAEYYIGSSVDVSSIELHVSRIMSFANYTGTDFINGLFYLPVTHPAYGIAGSNSTFPESSAVPSSIELLRPHGRASLH